MFENIPPELLENTCKIIASNLQALYTNEYGVFVLSSVLEHGQHKTKVAILNFIQYKGAALAVQRDGSKLYENAIRMLTKINAKHRHNADQVIQLLDALIYLPLGVAKQAKGGKGNKAPRSQLGIDDVLTNKYGNYVMQAAYDVADMQRRQHLLTMI